VVIRREDVVLVHDVGGGEERNGNGEHYVNVACCELKPPPSDLFRGG